MAEILLPDVGEVKAAVPRVAPHLHRTPLVHSTTLSEMCGTEIWLKCENLQKTGSFKPRGGINRLATLTPAQREAGVITISAGNNAQGVAFAARAVGVHAVLVMPETAVASKVEATRGYGAEVVLHGDVHAAFARLEELRQERGLTMLHPFDDPMLIAGHGTLGLELQDQLSDIDAVVCGVGGGGLCSGLGIALQDSGIAIHGVEPTGAATMSRALEAGTPVRLDHVETIADGLAPPFVGELNLEATRRHVESVVCVTDDEMRRAMRVILERTKYLVEPSGAAALAALLSGRLSLRDARRTVIVLSGGNVDLHRLPELLD
jgi:threonine dehydratase